jgi:hypothetical protein
MWKNMVEPDRPQTTRRHMRSACWITKATNTHSEYVILIAVPQQQWLCECAWVLRYTYIACLVCTYLQRQYSSSPNVSTNVNMICRNIILVSKVAPAVMFLTEDFWCSLHPPGKCEGDSGFLSYPLKIIIISQSSNYKYLHNILWWWLRQFLGCYAVHALWFPAKQTCLQASLIITYSGYL